MEFFQKNKATILIFTLAVFVRLALFTMYLHANNGDFIVTIRGADGYYETSENLIHGRGYSDQETSPYTPSALRPPAWILSMALIAGVFGSYVPVFIFQLILSALIPVMGMYLARRIITERHTPLVGLLLAFEPAAVFSSTMVVSETSFTFLFLAFAIFLFRYMENQTSRNIIWSAVFLGLSILVKPTVEFLPVLVPAGLLFMYRKKISRTLIAQCAYFLLASLLVVSPWVYRNYKTFGVFGLTSQAGYNLYTVLVPSVLSLDRGTSYEAEHMAIGKTLDAEGGAVTFANSDYYSKKAVAILSQHKIAFVKSLALSMVTFFTHDHMLSVLAYGGIAIPNLLDQPAFVLLLTNPFELARDIALYAASPGILVLVGRLFCVAIALLFFCGAWLYFRREKFSPFAFMALAFVAYFALMTTANGFGMNGRFRMPVSAFIVTFALYGLSVLRRSIIAKLSFR